MGNWPKGLVMAALVTALVVTGCSSGGGSSSGSGGEAKVSMNQMAFTPKELKVKAGTTVVWVNDDVTGHAVQHMASKPLFQTSADLQKGESFKYTFSKSGTYDVVCTTPGHKDAGMVMKVIVE